MKKLTIKEKEEKIRARAEAQVKRLYVEEEKKREQMRRAERKKVIPIFYASDDNYLPYLAVSLDSLKINANLQYRYEIYILHAGVSEAYEARIKKYADEHFNVTFVDVREKLKEVCARLQLRDYYTGATYYRIFIAGMFPQYDKALYLDGDTVVTGDISRLYNQAIGDNLVGAVVDGVVASAKVFRRYTKEVLGIEAKNYFNAGVLVMNLKKFRETDFFGKFRDLLLEYKFTVAQDQDYLNVLCKDSVRFLSGDWNAMPIGGERKKLPALIHYNLTAKPWRYASIPYAGIFWSYAEKNEFAAELRAQFGGYTAERRAKDAETEAALLKLASAEIEREDNFIKARRKAEKEATVYAFTGKLPTEV